MALALTVTVAWADSQNTIEEIYISNSNSITYTGKEVRPVVKAYHKVYGYEICTFDKKLNKLIQKFNEL